MSLIESNHNTTIPDTTDEFEIKIKQISDMLAKFLISKNRKYGNSVNKPLRIFSKADELDQIFNRIDDKLSRIAKGGLTKQESVDTIVDLVGYLMILLYNYWIRNLFNPNDLLSPKHMD